MLKKFSFSKELIILFSILFLFLFTRLFQIDSIPNSLYWDEASIGYNAYGLATDGKVAFWVYKT